MNLLQQQQSLHETEMEKWKEVLSASIALVDQVSGFIVEPYTLRTRVGLQAQLTAPTVL